MFKLENIQYCCEKCNNMENNIIEKKIMNAPKTLIIKIKKCVRKCSTGYQTLKMNLRRRTEVMTYFIELFIFMCLLNSG